MSYSTRRGVLKTLLFGGTALATPSALWAVEYGRGEGMPWAPMRGDPPYYGTTDARFFTPTNAPLWRQFLHASFPAMMTDPAQPKPTS
ncbi:MAG: hypothetical protein ABJQ42_00020 [Erythrobacter sp.]